MRKANVTILASVFIMALVAAGVGAGTMAYFSDVEKSTGNTFTAGKLDLKVDCAGGAAWSETDLTTEKFFAVNDVKPGDHGEVTISLHVYDNDAWARAIITMTKNDDVSSTEPELGTGDAQDVPADLFDGELAQHLYVMFWLDTDGDNIPDINEPILIPYTPLSTILLWGPNPGPGSNTAWFEIPGETRPLGDEYLQGCTTYHIGVAWKIPIETGNIIQSDSLSADVTFEVSQKRNQAYPWG